MITFKSLALLVLVLSTQVLSACVNNANFTYGSLTDDGNPQKNCKQIRNKEERRVAMCPIAEVNDACRQTCGACCENDAAYHFKLKEIKKSVGCDWITKNSKKKEMRFNKYCTKNNTQGKLHTWNGRSVRDACPKSCDFCFNGDKAIPTAPTPAPTCDGDDPAFSFNLRSNYTKEVRECSWLLQHKSPHVDARRKARYCVKPDINTACCESCYTPSDVPSILPSLSSSPSETPTSTQYTLTVTVPLNFTISINTDQLTSQEAIYSVAQVIEDGAQQFMPEGSIFNVLSIGNNTVSSSRRLENSEVAIQSEITILKSCVDDCSGETSNVQESTNDVTATLTQGATNGDLVEAIAQAATQANIVTGVFENASVSPESFTQGNIETNVKTPSMVPSVNPSASPSNVPSMVPFTTPSAGPTPAPTPVPTPVPTPTPSMVPSVAPSAGPSVSPSATPSTFPSSLPSNLPSLMPSSSPSDQPSATPSDQPSALPSLTPSDVPSVLPSDQPSATPSALPSLIPSSSQQPSSLGDMLLPIAISVLGDCASTNNCDEYRNGALHWFTDIDNHPAIYINKEVWLVSC